MPEKRHPAPFPIKLCKVAIYLTTDENDLVVDPYCGIGTVGVACKELDRKFIGIEIDEKYFDIAVERIKKTQKYML